MSTTSTAASLPIPKLSSRALRFALRAAVVGIVLTAAIGALHMPFARPLLRKLTGGLVCPIQRGTPEQIDRGHALGAAAIRLSATRAAPARPALGFALDRTTQPELGAWAKAHDVSCSVIAGNATLQRCTDVPAMALGEPESLGPLEEATFEFKKSGELVNVQTMRRHLTAADAARVVGSLEDASDAVVGAPTKRAGVPTAAHLGRSFMSTFVAEHTYTDYRATISATNLAQTGIMVREEYLSVR